MTGSYNFDTVSTVMRTHSKLQIRQLAFGFKKGSLDILFKSCPCDKRNKILVVDDNVFNIFTLQNILKLTFNMQSDKALNG